MKEDEMKEMLRNNLCRVVFEKVNGEKRDMSCTLMESHIPDEFKPKGTGTAKRNSDTISAFDVKAGGWRSFRIDKVETFEAVNA